MSPSYQASSQPQVQHHQPGTQPWSVVGSQSNTPPGPLHSVQPSAAAVSQPSSMKIVILQAIEPCRVIGGRTYQDCQLYSVFLVF